ncbi:MAG: hypothetical protein N0C84_00575 [Candidatus Thiodiazotropha taylori]|uniref:Uncharacterized protein n=1 Tax=Candidatus Thiodiazotropha taylori TaxID=2792791 RepID=A0A9E4K961_9GAMM|nr:hypothetical protein [Candidatus Thiodiazotropha taylori]MCW4254939.1 hypothetical protein [Candidatus Thiodiazotropha taylori]
MKNYNSNIAFIDLLFNMLTGFVSLFLLSFLLINPIAEEGKIDPIAEFMVTMAWDENSIGDIDLWFLGPDGNRVGYAQKENGYMVLDRDDLGTLNDRFVINGQETIVRKNLEVVTINAIVPGEYFVNVHYFSSQQTMKEERGRQTLEKPPAPPETVVVELMDLRPYNLEMNREVVLTDVKQELTVFSFTVDLEGRITDIRTDIQIPVRVIGGSNDS